MNLGDIEKWEKMFSEYSEGKMLNIHGSYKGIGILRRNVLDVGCGDMEYLSYIERSEDNYLVGLDPSKNALKLAKENAKNKNVALVRGVAERLPFKKGSFNNALVIELMHHLSSLDNCRQVTEELYRVSNSKIFLTFHHSDYINALQNVNDGKMYFDEASAIKMLEKAGFKCNNMEILTSRDIWYVPRYKPWPDSLPPPETKAVIYMECGKS